MGVSYDELRRECQAPVAYGNDVAGLLYGDKASLPITKLLIDQGWSPNIATVGMLVTGVAGALLQPFGPVCAVLGAALLVLYYILDCVDGEVARYRKIEHARWGYYEYIFHFLVKPLAYVGVGLSLWRGSGDTWAVLAAMAASLATLWLKMFMAVPSLVFTGAVLGFGASGRRPWREYADDATERAALERTQEQKPGQDREVFRLRADLSTIRSFVTNFDVGLALLFVLSVVEWLFPAVNGLLPDGWSLRFVWLGWYGVILPLDFLDYLRTYVRKGHFDDEMVRLLARAHRFRLREEPRETGEPREAGERRA